VRSPETLTIVDTELPALVCPTNLVVDCANGAAYKVAPTVLRELGAKVDVIGNKPDGMNINRKP